jgi:hypothetical protein
MEALQHLAAIFCNGHAKPDRDDLVTMLRIKTTCPAALRVHRLAYLVATEKMPVTMPPDKKGA